MGGNPNSWMASEHPSGITEVGLFVELVHHEQFLTAWEFTASRRYSYILTTQDSWQKLPAKMTLLCLFLVKYLLQSTFITAAWPQFDLNFQPIFIGTKNLNKILALPIVLHQHLNLIRIFAIAKSLLFLKFYISRSCHLRTLGVIPGCYYMMCICHSLTCLFEALP